ncbi:MAG: RNA polymerase sigma factor, partial [Saprospiraceae bacterium]
EVIAAIRQLPPGYRAVISLYAIEGYTHDQVAKALDISVTSSRTQLHKARKKLVQILENQLNNQKVNAQI